MVRQWTLYLCSMSVFEWTSIINNNIAKKSRMPDSSKYEMEMDKKGRERKHIQKNFSKYIILFVTTNKWWHWSVRNNTSHERTTHKKFSVYISITWEKCKWKWYNFCCFFSLLYLARTEKNASLWTWSGHIKVMTRVRLFYHCISGEYWESINVSKGNAFSCWEHKWPH